MTNRKIALLAIPVLAAILIGGTFAPVAYADHKNDAECDALIKNFIDALIKGQDKRAEVLLDVLSIACFNSGAECEAGLDNLFRALDRGDVDLALHILDVLQNTLDCF